MGLTYGELTETPLGPISFFAGDKGLQRTAFKPLSSLKEAQGLQEVSPSLKGLEVVGALLAEINEYLFGIRKSFSVDIDWDEMPNFQSQVLSLTANIPWGQLTTYGEIAHQLGKPGSARAVGQALGNNPMPIVIPCHRVIGADRRLRGYAGGLRNKAFLLALEGHTIESDRVLGR